VPPRRNRGPIELRPNFHDGFIDGLLVNGLDARVFLRTASQEKFTIVLSGVKSLVLDDFRQGNIILSVDWLDPQVFTMSRFAGFTRSRRKAVLRNAGYLTLRRKDSMHWKSFRPTAAPWQQFFKVEKSK
jgi:hypothetical protein